MCKFTEAMGIDTLNQAFLEFKKFVKQGDREAINTCIKKTFPDAKPKNFINIDIDVNFKTISDLINIYNVVIDKLFKGSISIEDCESVIKILAYRKDLFILSEIEPRLNLLETALKNSQEINFQNDARVIEICKERDDLRHSYDDLNKKVKSIEMAIKDNNMKYLRSYFD